MNDNQMLQFLQQGFRVTVGATTSLLETIQDPQKRSEALSELQTELSQKTQEWAAKGEITEQEAKNFVENFLRRQNQNPDGNGTTSNNEPTTSVGVGGDGVQADLQELTQQIVELKYELERLRKSQDER